MFCLNEEVSLLFPSFSYYCIFLTLKKIWARFKLRNLTILPNRIFLCLPLIPSAAFIPSSIHHSFILSVNLITVSVPASFCFGIFFCFAIKKKPRGTRALSLESVESLHHPVKITKFHRKNANGANGKVK
jgi:hypothetical protein